MDADRTRRRQIFAALSPRFGKLLPPAFLKNPGLAGVERLHPLTEGIHKPAWSNYALSITTMLKSQYHDQTYFNPDGTWWMHYSPKAGSLDIAVNRQKFVYSDAVEADAAHIIGKGERGTDDPRNGLALSKSVHWAFDQGIFTISDQYEIILHPEARRASSQAFPLLETDRKRITLPTDPAYYPHQEALAWHREERFGRFAKG